MYLTQALHRAAQQHGEHIAVRFHDRQWTFRELIDRVARLAGALRKLGMAVGDRVAMLALNSDRYLEYQMAVPWGGGVLNPCNTRWSPEEILYALEDSGCTILFVDDLFVPLAEQLRGQAATLRHVIYCGDKAPPPGIPHYESLLSDAAAVADCLRRDNDLAGLFYTGGTTGFPKGVMLSHTNLCSASLALCVDGMVSRNGTYLHAAPMFHLADMGIAAAHWAAGNAHSIIPAFNARVVLETIASHGVTHTLLVPTMIQMMIDDPAMREERDLSSLRTIVFGASPISETLLERAMRSLPGVDFVHAYGMTELAPLATLNPGWHHSPETRCAKLRSAGRAGACTEVRIVDHDDNEVPHGTVGEVVVRGPNVMQGYWKLPELTKVALRGGWMHTGDGAYMDEEGFIFIVDRLKDMIISGGENIFCVEVENVLVKHPYVATCAVIGIPSDRWGEVVHAFVVRRDEKVTASELIDHCKVLLAHYKCPQSIEFVAALPVSGAGKILKAELRKPFWRGRDREVH
jgi:acyl-CoA synthetase (AMP-forming)/AMP-acid ligase II